MSDAAPNPPWRRNPWLWGIVFCLLLPWLVRPFMRRVPEPPPVMTQLPDFALLDQDGQPFTRADLRGRAAVVAFVFSSCSTVCPRILDAAKRLEGWRVQHPPYPGFESDLRLLAITVDPETDSPERLRELAARHGLDPARWRLLTGEPGAVRSMVQQGFAQALGPKTETAPGVFDIAHSARLALVDQDGGVRGFYGTDDAGLDEVFHRATHVLREQRRAAGRAARR